MRIRGGSGLGDSLYVRPIAEHFAEKGQQVTALTNYPDIYRGSKISTEPFSRTNCQVVAHYVNGKSKTDTTQWQDVCAAAGVNIPMRFDWAIQNQNLVDQIQRAANGRRIILAHGGRAPMGRSDGFAMELLPAQWAFDDVLKGVSDYLVVSIGGIDGARYQLTAEIDLTGKTSVADMLDLAWICDGVVAQCSFAVPMAECFDKPLLAVWSERAKASNQAYIKTITPQKVLSKPSSRWVMDDWDQVRITEAVDAFRQF